MPLAYTAPSIHPLQNTDFQPRRARRLKARHAQNQLKFQRI
jgi:hypothetical protein